MIRAAVFVDYEDCLRRAHEAFRVPEEVTASDGIDPLRLASRLISASGGRSLTELRVYRAVPDARSDVLAFGRTLSEIERWRAAGATVVRRPEGDPREPEEPGRKGLIVLLAVDLVVLAIRDRYDVAILCSSDPDVLPAVSAVLNNTWKTVEFAEWRVEVGPSPRLGVKGETVRSLWLDRSVYRDVRVVEG